MSKVRAVAGRSYPVSEASGGWEETSHVRDQGRPGEATSRPRPGVVTLRSHPEPEARASGRKEQPEEWWLRSTGGPRGAIPPSRSGTVAVRRNPSSKVKNSGCALLEQP